LIIPSGGIGNSGTYGISPSLGSLEWTVGLLGSKKDLGISRMPLEGTATIREIMNIISLLLMAFPFFSYYLLKIAVRY
jgi:hypothetical protein